MPTYDYVCQSCRRVTEVVHGVHGTGPTECPACGGPVRKAVVAPAVHFKGSGWAKKERGASTATKAAAKASGSDADSKSTGDSADGSAGAAGSSKDSPEKGTPTTGGSHSD